MRLLGVLMIMTLVGCGNSGGSPDMAESGDMALLSRCGHPGDPGNSIGVGKFCRTGNDCTGPGLKTNVCSALGNGGTPMPSDTYFCTIYPCHPDAGTNECGDNAACVCQGPCACAPTGC
jgi:hypothetical protein